jgi:hypothetical protein
MEGGKKSGENDKRQIDSISCCTVTNNHGPISMPSLLFWSVLLLVYQSPSVLPAAAAASTPSAAATDAVRRRCIGQFFAGYTSSSSDEDDGGQNERNEDGSILNWLNENTSCDLQSEPSVSSYPSWKKKKKKNLNNNYDSGSGSGSSDVSTTARFDNEDRPYHVVILLMENHPIHHEIVTLSSGFLVAGLEVTIFYIFQDDDTLETNRKNQMMADSIQSEIFQRMPLHDNIIQRARDSFRFVKLNLNEYIERAESKNETDNYISDSDELDSCKNKVVAAHPLDRCAIKIAPAVLKLLLEYTDTHIKPKTLGKQNSNSTDRNNDEDVGNDRFDFVLMMDASFLGGLLFSEIKMIPTIAIGSHHTLMMAIEHEPKWNPSPKRTTLDRMDRIFLQRLYSLGLTGSFLRANQMRYSLGLKQLKRLKSPLEHFLPVVAMLVDLIPSGITLPLSSSMSSVTETSLNNKFYRDDGSRQIHGNNFHVDGQGYGYRVHNIQPLLSPCTLCLDQRTSWKIEKKSSVIMVAPKAGVSAKWTRSLIRALSLTKQSLEGYDDCLFDRATCQNGVVGFEVDWLAMQEEKNDHFPQVVPSFIRRDVSVNLLDSAIRNPNTIIALIHCDSESNILSTFRIEVFCISQSNRIPIMYSVEDLLHEKGYGGAATDINLANDRDSPSRLLQESISRENLNPKEVATRLLSVLRQKSIGSETSTTREQKDYIKKRNREVATWATSGLQRTVKIVQSAARVHRENSWKNPQEMQRVTTIAITKALHSMDGILRGENNIQQVDNNSQDVEGKQGLYDAFAVFVAWLVFISATIYMMLKDSIVIKRFRQHHHHHYYRNGGSIIDSVLTRLKDLDDAWDILLSWSSDLTTAKPVFDTHNDRIGRSGPNENAVISVRKEQQLQHNNNHHNNNHHGQMRRRRKMKTTR